MESSLPAVRHGIELGRQKFNDVEQLQALLLGLYVPDLCIYRLGGHVGISPYTNDVMVVSSYLADIQINLVIS